MKRKKDPCEVAPKAGPRLGAHVSIQGGLHLAFERGREIGCDCIQIFTRNQTQWRSRPLMQPEADTFQETQRQGAIGPVVVHDSYLINLASQDQELWEKSCRAFQEEMQRAEQLAIPYLVFHPGAHTGAGEQEGLKRVAEALNQLMAETESFQLRVLIESTAGQGTTLGYCFEHLRFLLDQAEKKERIGICLDTCHLFAAGYDLRTEKEYLNTMKQFDQVVGLSSLFAFHLNDSKKGLGSRVDRHEHIGEGQIGLDGFRLLLNDSRWSHLPMILETPGEDEDFRRNLSALRNLIGSS